MTEDLRGLWGNFSWFLGTTKQAFSGHRSLAQHHCGAFGAGVRYEDAQEVTLWLPFSQLLVLLYLP